MVARTAPGGFIPDPFVLCGGPEGVVARCASSTSVHLRADLRARFATHVAHWPGRPCVASPPPSLPLPLSARRGRSPLRPLARDVPRQRSRPARHTRLADLRPVATVAL